MSYSISQISPIMVTYENYGYDRLDSKFRNKKHTEFSWWNFLGGNQMKMEEETASVTFKWIV
jgi:hypothetical protein